MLQKVQISGVPLPEMYLADCHTDFRKAKEVGLPVFIWRKGMDDFIEYLLYPALKKLFPGLNHKPRKKVRSKIWIAAGSEEAEPEATFNIAEYDQAKMLETQLADDPSSREHVADPEFVSEDGYLERLVDVPETWRYHSSGTNGGYNQFNYEPVDVLDFVGDVSSYVDVDVLMQLGMLPQFVGNIVDCIKVNVTNNLRWSAGKFNKRNDSVGKYIRQRGLPNLIICDVSHSIPDGIAATMLSLLDTLRGMCNAYLIITSARSGFYAPDDPLPDIQTLRDYYGRSNEAQEFMAILQTHVAGRHWGNIFSFGDYDCPENFTRWLDDEDCKLDLSGTVVEEVWNFHTRQDDWTGYARWAQGFVVGQVHMNTEWCSMVDKSYTWK